MALVTNLVTRIQEIGLVFGTHDVFRPGRHERNGNGHGPKPATFVVAAESPAAEEPQAPAPPPAPGTLLSCRRGSDVEMPDPTSRLDSLGPLADQRRLSAPRMMSGQFPDEILDPVIREMA